MVRPFQGRGILWTCPWVSPTASVSPVVSVMHVKRPNLIIQRRHFFLRLAMNACAASSDLKKPLSVLHLSQPAFHSGDMVP